MVEIKDITGKVIHTSKNLRGLITHFRRQSVASFCIEYNQESDRQTWEAILTVLFENGDYCRTKFASYYICQKWIQQNHTLRSMNYLTRYQFDQYLKDRNITLA